MLSRWSNALAALFVLALLGCPAPEPATEVLVFVRSDLTVPGEIDKLRIRVLDAEGKATRKEQPLDLTSLPKTSASGAFPLSFSLNSPTGEAAAFQVVVTGIHSAGKTDAEREIVETQAKGKFSPGVRVILELDLTRSCLRMLCREGSDRTCVRGACGPVPTPELKPDDGTTGNRDPSTAEAGAPDGGMKSGREDGGRSDGGGGPTPVGDGGPMPACEVDAQCSSLLAGATPADCAVAVCTAGKCELRADDADQDGHAAKSCSVPGRAVTLGDDCDDASNGRFPGAWDGPEVDGKKNGCDQQDNDCDGMVDEERGGGKSCTCDPAQPPVSCAEQPNGTAIVWPTGAPVGNCRAGKRSCVEGAFTACMGAVAPAAKDSCAPGDDADCDGLKNEECTCQNGATQPCGLDEGDCEFGMSTCQNGAWSACVGGLGPRGADTCEPGSDRDCDGKPNEGCECVNGTQSTCAAALRAQGDCAMRPVTCLNGRWQTQQCAPTSDELCNDDNRDENCNGTVNERRPCACINGQRQSCLVLPLFGPCGARGRTLCTAGQWGQCSVQPERQDSCVAPDLFTGAGDENCNGRPNEPCDCTIGQSRSCSRGNCTGGTQTCNGNGRWGDCQNCMEPPPPPDPEPPEPEPSALIL